MSSPKDAVVRRAAHVLAAELGPGLPGLVELKLAPPAQGTRSRAVDPVSLASLLVSIGSLGWHIYQDLKKGGQAPARRVLALRIREEVSDLHGASAAQCDRMIEAVVDELERGT